MGNFSDKMSLHQRVSPIKVSIEDRFYCNSFVANRNWFTNMYLFAAPIYIYFYHRWILLCFKREFIELDALRMWEACWAHFQTDYFHLFLCVAIIALYGEDVVEQDLPADEMLLHFSSLSMHMNGEVVLKKVCILYGVVVIGLDRQTDR